MNELPKTMRAVAIDRYGGPEALAVREVPVPSFADDEVLIRVRAAGVGIWDVKQRDGAMKPDREHFPLTLGAECAGEIVACGSAVNGLRVGDAVFAYIEGDNGGQAEYVNVKASAVARKPEHLSFEEAAAIPVDAITAHQALVDEMRVGGDTILYVAGGSGGVGTFAVQLGHHLGAGVIASAGPKNLDYVRGLGAEVAFDYTKDDPVNAVRRRFEEGVDAAIDCVGGKSAEKTIETVRDGGRFAELTMTDVGAPRGIQVHHVMSQPSAERLTQLARLFDARAIRVYLDTAFPLDRVADAYAKVESRHVRGKVVLSLS